MTWIRVSPNADQLLRLIVVAPNCTLAALANPVPVIATVVPPGPLDGFTIDTAGVGLAP
jgi:hypothetical protein